MLKIYSENKTTSKHGNVTIVQKQHTHKSSYIKVNLRDFASCNKNMHSCWAGWYVLLHVPMNRNRITGWTELSSWAKPLFLSSTTIFGWLFVASCCLSHWFCWFNHPLCCLNPCGGFPKLGYPEFIIYFRLGCSTVNHPGIGGPPFQETSIFNPTAAWSSFSRRTSSEG